MSEQRITWFNERNAEKSLILNPKYQRKPVWSLKNKKFLIDTIIRNLPVPEIYMQVKTNTAGKSEYIIVDGQQRLRAILEFIEGEFEIDEEDNQEYGGKNFQDLPDGIQKDFWGYKISVREIETNSDEEIRGIFQRMNKNVVPLNQQELRNATYIGHFINLMNSLADEQEFYTDNGIFSASDIKRMKDAEFISELFVAIMHGVQNQKDQLDDYYRIYDDKWTTKESAKTEYNKIIDLISEIFISLRGTRWKEKSDFYSLFYSLLELNRDYIVPAENYELIKTTLTNFSEKVSVEGDKSKDSNVKEYYNAVSAHTNNKTQREKRNKIVRGLIIEFLIPRDKKRLFNEEERMIIWAKSDKKCKICGKALSYSEYEADHITAHNKGGLTIIPNGQVLCKTCNASKKDK